MKIDQTDINILKYLQSDARLNLKELSSKVFLSVSACQKRIKKMESAKIITRYKTEINLSALANLIKFYVTVRLDTHLAEKMRIFEETVCSCHEVVECQSLGGGLDYLLKIYSADIKSYQKLINKLLKMKIGIVEYNTYIVTETVKEETYPISSLQL